MIARLARLVALLAVLPLTLVGSSAAQAQTPPRVIPLWPEGWIEWMGAHGWL